jgi:glycosyltransferase involved in cell wall biosynthesis
LEIRYLRHAAAVVALTEAEKLDVAAIVPGQRIDVIPNAIDADSLALCNLAREARRTRQGGAMQAMFLGRYDAWTKGLDFLCQLVGRLRERGLNMELSLYGTQDPRPERQREFQELANRQLPYVRINSAVYGEEKAAALATCDVYFQTSRYEAFGISVVEAMAVGVPVVITDTMHLSSVIQQADAGFVIPFDLERATTILLDALAKPNALLQKGEHGRQYVMQNFTSESVATRTIEVYQDALAANKNVSAARPGSGSRA